MGAPGDAFSKRYPFIHQQQTVTPTHLREERFQGTAMLRFGTCVPTNVLPSNTTPIRQIFSHQEVEMELLCH